ncbi:hypothetical protein Harreka1_41 [Olleya phage Harreka_1]|uniref:Uncharacterized protein n=1 Tax=Olleya phage Harreka_1 TaxID=2745673 RepID=A0A8E4ZC12_9CAUD|nr:hypothetical protein M1M26_gp41 [Olleya phage Harreka_1]QQV90448.1 hypothetical protein Harreka1_41 [Olleya phage Harreka_1]
MKQTKLPTGVLITYDEKGIIKSVSSPYWADESLLTKTIKYYHKKFITFLININKLTKNL